MQFLPITSLLAALSCLLALATARPNQAPQRASTMNMKIMAMEPHIKNSADYNYVFTVFTWGSQSNLYVYTSEDGVHFDLLKGPAYVPSNTLIRDPSPILHTDGYYYIAHTTSWESRYFAIARSSNLIDWTPYINISSAAIPGITRTWAPEFFQDPDTGKTHIIVSLGKTTSNFHPYLYTAEDESLKKWSGPVEMTGFNPNYIDTFVVKEGEEYHAFTKNENTKWVEHAVAETLEGPWTFAQTGNFSGWDHLEGPCVTKTMDGKWRLYADAYESDVRKYMYAESDDLYNWDNYEEVPELSGFVRHGTVLKIH